MSLSRRDFLGTTTMGVTAGPLLAAKGDKAGMPVRVLGKTGAKVSILGFGCGSRLPKYQEEPAIEALTRALDHGITYLDTADDYGKNHLSEQRVGKTIKGRRQGLFLATKLSDRDGNKSRQIVEESLKALQVDQVDLIHIHVLTSIDDLAKIEAKGGVLEQLQKIKSEKLNALHRDHLSCRSGGTEGSAGTAQFRRDADGAERRPGKYEKRQGQHGPERRHQDQLPATGAAGRESEEDGRGGHEGDGPGCLDRAGDAGETAAILADAAGDRMRRGDA